MGIPDGSLVKGAPLWATARRLLAPSRSYAQAHVTAKLETYLKVSPEKAEEGFSLMVNQGVLTATYGEPRKYYLGDATPF